MARILSVDCRLKGKIIVDCRQLFMPFKIADCRLRCRFVGRNLRYEMEIVYCIFCHFMYVQGVSRRTIQQFLLIRLARWLPLT